MKKKAYKKHPGAKKESPPALPTTVEKKEPEITTEIVASIFGSPLHEPRIPIIPPLESPIEVIKSSSAPIALPELTMGGLPAPIVVAPTAPPGYGRETVGEECLCKVYDGDSYNCSVHEPVTECPRCHCVGAEREIPGAFPPMRQLNCTICGIFYMRNIVNGEYLHLP